MIRVVTPLYFDNIQHALIIITNNFSKKFFNSRKINYNK